MVFSDFLFVDVLEYVDNFALLELLIIPDEFVNKLCVMELCARVRRIHGIEEDSSYWGWLKQVPQDDQFDCYLELFQNELCSYRNSSHYCPTVNSSKLLWRFKEVYDCPIDQAHLSLEKLEFYEQILAAFPISYRISDTCLEYLRTIARRFEAEISTVGIVEVIFKLIAASASWITDKNRAILFGKMLNIFRQFLSHEVFEMLRDKYVSVYFQVLCDFLIHNNHSPLIQRLIEYGPEKYSSDESLSIIQAVRNGDEALPNRLLKLKRFPVDEPKFVNELIDYLSHHNKTRRQFTLKVLVQIPKGLVNPSRLETILISELPAIDITEFQRIVQVFKIKSWVKDTQNRFIRYKYSSEFIERLINLRGFRYGLTALNLIPRPIDLKLSSSLHISREHLMDLERHPMITKVIQPD